MLSPAKLQLLNRLKILGKKIFNSQTAGDYQSFLRGSGYDFLYLRNYHEGDDVRFIDWNSMAKTGNLLVKEVVPERDRAVILLLDCSASNNYSSTKQLKSDLALDLITSLSWLALKNKDKIGLLTFGKDELKWLPCNKSRGQFFSIFNLAEEKIGKTSQASIKTALDFVLQLKQKKSLIFFISDFIDEDFFKMESLWRMVGKKHQIIPVFLKDILEKKFDSSEYLIDCKDPETGEKMTLFSSIELTSFLKNRAADQFNFFKRIGLKSLELFTGEDIIKKLTLFFEGKGA